MIWLILCLASGVGALLVGMLGFGSSLVILPVLLLVFPTLFEPEVAIRLAVGTTMATMIVGALTAGYTQWRNGAVHRALLGWMIVPYLLGAGAGPWLGRFLPVELLGYLIVTVLVLVAWLMLHGGGPATRRRWRGSEPEIALVHLVIGLVSSVAGVASGLFAIPYLSRFELPLRTVIGTSTVAAALYSLFATLGHASAGAGFEGRPPWCVGFVYVPAFLAMSVTGALCGPLGVRLAHRVSERWLKRLLAAFILVAAAVVVLR